MITPTAATPQGGPSFPAISFGRLKQHHPEYRPEHMRLLAALYEGGSALLDNPEVMARAFPKHEGETAASYAERLKRAYYIGHLGAVVNYIVAGLAQDPLRLVDENGEQVGDGFWADLMLDASAPGGAKRSLDLIVRSDWTTDALVHTWSWLRSDMPPPDAEAVTKLDEERAGVTRGYFVHVPAITVTDWSMTAGRLNWIRVHSCTEPDENPAAARDVVVHEWTMWTADGFATYRVPIGKGGKDPQSPRDEDMIQPIDVGRHSFGAVPFTRLVMPPGLRAGEILYSLALEMLNQSCADSWNRLRNGYQQLYEFLGGELPGVDTPIGQAQEDPHRAKRQRRGPGTVQERGAGDDAKYVGPDMGGTAVQRQALAELRDDIYRVLSLMALSQDTQGAMIRRSGDSKEQDGIATEVVLGAAGRIVHIAAEEAIGVLSVGVGEEAPSVRGYERFNAESAGKLIERAAMMVGVEIPSARYQQLRNLRIARADLGNDASPEDLKTIEQELAGAHTQDQIDMKAEADAANLTRVIKGEPPPGALAKAKAAAPGKK